MNKLGKIIFVLFVFMAVLSCPLFAQGYPVIDIANLMQAINTLYATYDQITTAIEQVQNTYQQLQKQIEMVKNMDWDKVGEKIGDMDLTSVDGILNLRHQIKDVTKLVNANMNLVNNVQDTLTKKTVSFGGKQYTFGGLFGFGAGSEGTTIFDLPKNVSDYHRARVSGLDRGDELFPAGAVEIRPGAAVVGYVQDIRKTVLTRVILKNFLLVCYAVGFALKLVVMAESLVKDGEFFVSFVSGLPFHITATLLRRPARLR